MATTAYVDSAIGDNDTLAEILANGNTTGGTDISVSAGDDILLTDTSELKLGTDADFKIKHTGTEANIHNYTGNLYITNDSTDGDIIFENDNGSGGVTSYITLDGSHNKIIAHKNLHFDDNVKIEFGNYANPDLEIYHDAANSYIDTSTGSLLIRNTNDNYHVIIQSDNGGGGVADYFRAKGDTGEAILYHYGNEKFKTTSTGVTVTGGASFTDNIDINGNNKHIRFVDTNENWQIKAGDGANNFKIHSQSLAADYLTLEGGGQLNLGEYGSGSFTGTATYRLAVDSSGDVIEIPIGGGAVDGSGTANTVTMWSDTDTITDAPITISGNDATFSGNIVSETTSGNKGIKIITTNTAEGFLIFGDAQDNSMGGMAYNNATEH